MKKIILLAFTICTINSCKKKEYITIKQIVSDQIVTITPNLKKQIQKIVSQLIFQQSLK